MSAVYDFESDTRPRPPKAVATERVLAPPFPLRTIQPAQSQPSTYAVPPSTSDIFAAANVPPSNWISVPNYSTPRDFNTLFGFNFPDFQTNLPLILGHPLYWGDVTANNALSVVTSSTAASIAALATMTEFSGNTSPAAFITPSDPLSGYERYQNENWDGYGADPIEPETLAAARRFLRLLPQTFGEPDIAPGTDGTIGLEWAFKNRPLRKLFIDIGPGNMWSGYWRRASGDMKTLPTMAIGTDTRGLLETLFKELDS